MEYHLDNMGDSVDMEFTFGGKKAKAKAIITSLQQERDGDYTGSVTTTTATIQFVGPITFIEPSRQIAQMAVEGGTIEYRPPFVVPTPNWLWKLAAAVVIVWSLLLLQVLPGG